MQVPEHTIHYLEVVTPDVAAVRKLYEQAYGWRFRPEPELGNAFVAELPNGSRCGIRAPLRDTETPIVRTYLRVVDLDQAARRAEQLGAQLAIARMELGAHGTIALYLIGGIEQGLWQLPS
jgi:predicted enzyme related to lactoylglutathione lyase